MVGEENVKEYREYSDLSRFIIDTDTMKPNNDPITGCVNGDYHHDSTNKHLYVCINGKGREGLYHQ